MLVGVVGYIVFRVCGGVIIVTVYSGFRGGGGVVEFNFFLGVCVVWGCLAGCFVVWRCFVVCLGVVLLLNST